MNVSYQSYIKYRLYEVLFHLDSPEKAMTQMEKEFSTSLVELEAAASQALLDYNFQSTAIH